MNKLDQEISKNRSVAAKGERCIPGTNVATLRDVTPDERFIGAWHQTFPEIEPNTIAIRFDDDGLVHWAMTGLTSQSVTLAWRIEKGHLITSQPGAGEELISRFWFEGPDVLVLEFADIRHVYERDGREIPAN